MLNNLRKYKEESSLNSRNISKLEKQLTALKFERFRLSKRINNMDSNVINFKEQLKLNHLKDLDIQIKKLESKLKAMRFIIQASQKEFIKGGLAEGQPDSKYNSKQLEMGRKVEMEHTVDPRIANEISKDHLEEDSIYYTHLKKMEDDAKKEEGKIKDLGES